jgi:predicted ATPase
MVTVLGTGGVGKTRLTTEVAAQLLDEFQDGIRFVDLSALREDVQVLPAIVQATGAADPLLSPNDALLDWLRKRELLLVLDNCEQVVSGVAEVCSEILRAAPGVTLLATSRVPIHIRGERQMALEPLPTGDDGPNNAAVQLFVERATEVNETFTPAAGVADEVAEICRMVDGLPLAIELAAAWVRILTPEALHRRLRESRAILRGGARDLPDRQRTLASTIAWSYDLLEPEDQRAFRRLAVFRGGIAVDAAAAVIWEAPVEDPLWALSRLDALVQANLLQVAPDPTGEPRFVMLQTIQEFAIGIMTDHDRRTACRAHASYFSSMAASAEMNYRGPEASIWLRRLDVNFDNLRAAIAWLASPENDTPVDALETVNHLSEYFELRNRNLENRTMLTAALDVASLQPSIHVARSLARLGSTWLGHPEQAEEYYRRSIEMMESLPDAEPPFDGLVGLMALAQMQGNLAAAVSYARDFLHHARNTDRPEMIANALLALGLSLSLNGEPDEAIECWNESRAISAQLGDEVGLAWIQRAEAEMWFWQGDHTRAEQLYLQAIAALEASSGRKLTAVCELGVAKIAALRADRATAQSFLTSAVDEISRGGFDLDTLLAVTTGAIVCTLVLNVPATAIELFSAAQSWSRATGIRETPQGEALNKEIWQRATLQVGAVKRIEAAPLSLRAALELLQETLRTPAGPSSSAAILRLEI